MSASSWSGARDLMVSNGLVAFIASDGQAGQIVSSAAAVDGRASGPWQSTQPCEDTAPEHLTSAANALWALCADGSVATTEIGDPDVPVWTTLRGTDDADAMIAARGTTDAVIADDAGLTLVARDGTRKRLSDVDLSGASLFGFTNETLGFAVAAGEVLQTEDGGRTWNQVEFDQ